MMNWLKKLAPRSIEGQMVALFALALLVQLAALTVLEMAKHDSVIETASQERIFTRFATYLPLIERLPPEDLESFIGSTSTCHAGYRVSETPFPRTLETEDTRAVGRSYAGRTGLAPQAVLVGYAALERSDFTYPECSFDEITLPQIGIVIGVQMENGKWFEIEVHPHEWHYREIVGWMTQMGAIFLFTAAISFFLLRQINRPMRALTGAVQSFGDGLDVSPVPVSGPDDMRRMIASFNTMQKAVAEQVKRRSLTLAAISHDIRTPLTSLRLRAEMVTDETVREELISSIEKMERINTSALEFLQSESSVEPMRTIDVHAMLQSECDEFEELGHAVKFSGDAGILLSCRPEAMARASRNLIDNAIKYGGEALVTLRQEQDDIIISVSDPGAGISDVDMRRALEPFERLSEARTSGMGGFGLGLAVVQAIIAGHGGTIDMRADQPTGFIVTLRLPMAGKVEGGSN